jgi:hypothetical protein
MRQGLLVTLLFLFTGLAAHSIIIAQEAKPLTNDDVIQLVKAGFDEDTIIKAVEANSICLPRWDPARAGLS